MVFACSSGPVTHTKHRRQIDEKEEERAVTSVFLSPNLKEM